MSEWARHSSVFRNCSDVRCPLLRNVRTRFRNQQSTSVFGWRYVESRIRVHVRGSACGIWLKLRPAPKSDSPRGTNNNLAPRSRTSTYIIEKRQTIGNQHVSLITLCCFSKNRNSNVDFKNFKMCVHLSHYVYHCLCHCLKDVAYALGHRMCHSLSHYHSLIISFLGQARVDALVELKIRFLNKREVLNK